MLASSCGQQQASSCTRTLELGGCRAFLKAPHRAPDLAAAVLVCIASYGHCSHVRRCPTSLASARVGYPSMTHLATPAPLIL